MRTLMRGLVLLLAVGLVGGAIVVGQSAKSSAEKMADAATALLGQLSAEEKKAATFPFDDPHRTTWFFTPQQDASKKPTRKGLRLELMTEKQKAAVLDLLKAGLSKKGYEQATTIMSLESLLAELEGKSGAMVRNQGWYFVSIFGEPGAKSKWGWRVEGHHLSINVTLDGGKVISATPVLFGSNPAEVKNGDRKGLRPLPETEDLAKKLIAGLSDEQKKAARQEKQLSEIKEKQPDADLGTAKGIPATKLTADQAKSLLKLVEAYADRLPEDVAAIEMKNVADAGTDKLHFAYFIDEDAPGKPWSYRVQGPTFAIEFLNVQADGAKNPANHIHSAWRTLPKDFGLGAK